MIKKKIIQEDNDVYQSYFQETGHSSTHTVAYLKYKDGKLQLMWNTKKGKKYFEPLDDLFADYINKPIQIDIDEFELKIKHKKYKLQKGE